MARVFISYRRADGQYAVGWIEERLRRLDEVTHLRTAFRDNSLRLGDDLGDRLADEVRDCDVLIAVVGPHWRGVRDDGSARIDDSIDWVGREIVSALADGKRIIPVLIGGAEPLQAADLPEALRPFADLLAVRFEGLDDLELLERDLREYLDELDHERARLSGLDEPIVPPSARQPAWVWVLALVAGGAAGATAAVEVRQRRGEPHVARIVDRFVRGVDVSLRHRAVVLPSGARRCDRGAMAYGGEDRSAGRSTGRPHGRRLRPRPERGSRIHGVAGGARRRPDVAVDRDDARCELVDQQGSRRSAIVPR